MIKILLFKPIKALIGKIIQEFPSITENRVVILTFKIF